MSVPIIPEHDPPQFPAVVVDLFAGVVMTIMALVSVAITTRVHETLGFLIALTAVVGAVYAIGSTTINMFGGDQR